MHSHSRDWCVTLALVVGVLWFASGCSSKPKTTADAKPVSGTDEQIFLGDTIEKNYDPNVIMKRGEAFFEKEEFELEEDDVVCETSDEESSTYSYSEYSDSETSVSSTSDSEDNMYSDSDEAKSAPVQSD